MKYNLCITSSPKEGRETDFNKWYDDIHLGEVLQVPGFKSAERFRRLGMDGVETKEYVTIFEVETDNPAALLQSLFSANGQMNQTDSIDVSAVRMEFLRPAGTAGKKLA